MPTPTVKLRRRHWDRRRAILPPDIAAMTIVEVAPHPAFANWSRWTMNLEIAVFPTDVSFYTLNGQPGIAYDSEDAHPNVLLVLYAHQPVTGMPWGYTFDPDGTQGPDGLLLQPGAGTVVAF